MKHFLSFLLITCLSYTYIYSQEKISLGFKAGINIPGIGINSRNPVIDGFKTRLAPCCGIVLEAGLNNRWSLLNEVNYATLSFGKNGSQVIPVSAYAGLGLSSIGNLYANFNSKIDLKYVEVPLMVKYYVYQNPKTNFFVNGGVFAGILFKSNVKTDGRGNVYTDAAHQNPLFPFQISLKQEQDLSERIQPINFGLQFGAGFTWEGELGEFFINLNGNTGLINIQESSDDGANKTKEATITAGYLFYISK